MGWGPQPSGRAARQFEKLSLRLSDDARYALRAHPWPGNVRELENAIERAAILADESILPEHFPFAGAHSAPLGSAAGTLNMRDLERRAIEEALIPLEPEGDGKLLTEKMTEALAVLKKSGGAASL